VGNGPAGPLNQADYARRIGVNPSTVNRWIKRGRIRLRPDGLIDPETADRERLVSESPMPHHQARKAQFEEAWTAPPPARAEDALSSDELSRALKLETYRLQKAKADQANLELDRAAGLLVERVEVEYLLADLAATLQSKLGSIPALLGPALAAHRGDVGAIHQELEAVTRDLLTELAAHLERQGEAHLGPVTAGEGT
jgi:hypothetical protein